MRGQPRFRLGSEPAKAHLAYIKLGMLWEAEVKQHELQQRVWGTQYVDELVQIAINDDPQDGTESVCETQYWVMQDANYNVLGLCDSGGLLVERYEYTPYGKRTVFFSPGINDTGLYAPTYASRRVSVSSVLQPYGLNEFGHQGLLHDEESGNVYNRARTLSPTLGRFMQRDPLGYVDGMSVYEYEDKASSPPGSIWICIAWLKNYRDSDVAHI